MKRYFHRSFENYLCTKMLPKQNWFNCTNFKCHISTFKHDALHLSPKLYHLVFLSALLLLFKHGCDIVVQQVDAHVCIRGISNIRILAGQHRERNLQFRWWYPWLYDIRICGIYNCLRLEYRLLHGRPWEEQDRPRFCHCVCVGRR